MLTVNVIKLTFIKPGSHPLAAKLDVPDLAEGGEDLLEMLPVHVPGQAPDVDLAGGRGPAPGPALAPRLGPGPISGLLWCSLQPNIDHDHESLVSGLTLTAGLSSLGLLSFLTGEEAGSFPALALSLPLFFFLSFLDLSLLLDLSKIINENGLPFINTNILPR